MDWPGNGHASGVSLRPVRRIWAPYRLQPHRARRFKLSQDPTFGRQAARCGRTVLDPPAHSLVLSVDEKSQFRRSTATAGPVDEEGPGGDDDPR